jgi:hypothetical protein
MTTATRKPARFTVLSIPGRDADPATYYVYDRLDGESSADMDYDAAVAECRRLNAAG